MSFVVVVLRVTSFVANYAALCADQWKIGEFTTSCHTFYEAQSHRNTLQDEPAEI